MSLPYAYCTQYGGLIDIFQAHYFYFSQPKPRDDLDFLCPTESCRTLERPARITGVNYKKIPGIDKFSQRLHYKIIPEYIHGDDCHWKEIIITIDKLDGELDSEPDTARLTNLKRSEVIDVFNPIAVDEDNIEMTRIDVSKIAAIGGLPTKSARIEAYKAYLKDNPNRTSRLHEVVHCYEALTPEEREVRELKIGNLLERTYAKYFAIAQYCSPCAYYPRIYFGLANVRKYHSGYSVRFQYSARQDDDIHCSVTVFIPNEMFDNFKGKCALLATLEAAREKTGNVLFCYAFGRIERAFHNDKHLIDIRIDSLHSLTLTLTDQA
jgi:hypothetical protein